MRSAWGGGPCEAWWRGKWRQASGGSRANPPDSEPSTPPPPFGRSPSPSSTGRQSVGDALRAFRNANGLCQNEREARWWIVRADLFVLPLPNFAWRRRAIDAHDVHHLLTGYPCTAKANSSSPPGNGAPAAIPIGARPCSAGRWCWPACSTCRAGSSRPGAAGGAAGAFIAMPISTACSTCRSPARETWCAETRSRHPELVSGSSSATRSRRLDAWMLKQVQHDGLRHDQLFDCRSLSRAPIREPRHPGTPFHLPPPAST